MFFSTLLAIPTESIVTASTIDFTWLFIKMLLLLVVVSILAILFLKFLAPKFGKSFHRNKTFNVLGRYALEPRKSLYLIKVGNKYLVIGTADHGINLITEVSKEDAGDV